MPTLFSLGRCWLAALGCGLILASAAGGHDWNGIALDKAGNIYVVDANEGQIWKVSSSGKAEVFRKGAARGEECDHAHHLAFDEKDNLCIPSG